MIETVTVETDTTTASTRSFPDGSHLIMISDAMMTLVDLLGALTSAWSKSKGRTRLTSTVRRATQARQSTQLAESDPLILGGAAALRYYIVHQRLWASSAKVSTHVDGRTAMNDTERGLGAWALFYILAHELGHVALEHTRQPKDAETQRHNELAADDFAYPRLHQTLWRWQEGREHHRDRCYDRALRHRHQYQSHVRPNPPGNSPPAFTVRLDRIAATYPPTPMRTVVASYWGFDRNGEPRTRRSHATARALLDGDARTPEFDTRHHRANYFTLIRGMDMITGYTPATCVAVHRGYDRPRRSRRCARRNGRDRLVRYRPRTGAPRPRGRRSRSGCTRASSTRGRSRSKPALVLPRSRRGSPRLRGARRPTTQARAWSTIGSLLPCSSCRTTDHQ